MSPSDEPVESQQCSMIVGWSDEDDAYVVDCPPRQPLVVLRRSVLARPWPAGWRSSASLEVPVPSHQSSMTRTRSGAVLASVFGALLLAGGCAPQPGAAPAAAPKTAAAIAVSAERVRRGEIQQAISYSGDIRAKSQVSVLSKTSGRVERVLVDMGSQVKAGDILAELEAENAQIQSLQVQASLAAAEAKLAQIRAGGKPDDIAAAEAGLIQQQVRLESMRAGGRAEDIALAEATLVAQQAKLELMQQGGRLETVAQAQAGLDAARAKLALVRKGATDDLRQAAQSAVDSDRAALASAEAALAALGGASAADVQAAQSQVDTLRAQVTSAEAALANLPGASAADLQTVQSAYDSAVAVRDAAKAALDQANLPISAQVAAAEATVAAAQASLDSAKSTRVTLTEGTVALLAGGCFKNPDGSPLDSNVCSAAQDAATAAVASAEKALTNAQAQLDLLKSGGTPATAAQLKAQVDQAEANIKTTKARLDAVRGGGIQAQRAQVDSQLVAARESLKSAEARLAAIKGGTLDAQRRAAEAQIVAARERLKSDQARVDQLAQGPQEEEIQQFEATVRQTEQQLALAEQPVTAQDLRAQRALVEQARLQVQKARRPYTSYDLQQQEQAVAQAEATLRSRTSPYSEYDLQAAEAVVEQARAQLELARLGVRETKVVAPVDSVVAERLVSPGALVSPSTPLFTLVPPELELVVHIEEAQLGQIAEGQPATLQVAAYPEQTFRGAVKAIAPTIDPRSRTASVRIEPQDGAGKLRPGMFAKLTIVTAARQGAILVPREAVVSGKGGQGTVIVVGNDNRARRLAVRLGLASERFVEVLGDLREGQLVVTSGVADLADGDLVSPQVESRTALAQ